MKNTVKLTFSAICAALATVIMLTGYFPYLTYAIPAVAGLLVMVVCIEIGVKYAVGTYIASAFLVLLTAEPETKILYVLLLGFYPIVKAVVEKMGKASIEWLIKFAVFNVCIVAYYKLTVSVLGIPFDDFGAVGKWGIYAFWAAANVVFVLYDIAVSRMAMFYISAIHPKISKIFKF